MGLHPLPGIMPHRPFTAPHAAPIVHAASDVQPPADDVGVQTGCVLPQCIKEQLLASDPRHVPPQAPPQALPQAMPPLAQVGAVEVVVLVVVVVVTTTHPVPSSGQMPLAVNVPPAPEHTEVVAPGPLKQSVPWFVPPVQQFPGSAAVVTHVPVAASQTEPGAPGVAKTEEQTELLVAQSHWAWAPLLKLQHTRVVVVVLLVVVVVVVAQVPPVQVPLVQGVPPAQQGWPRPPQATHWFTVWSSQTSPVQHVPWLG